MGMKSNLCSIMANLDRFCWFYNLLFLCNYCRSHFLTNYQVNLLKTIVIALVKHIYLKKKYNSLCYALSELFQINTNT